MKKVLILICLLILLSGCAAKEIQPEYTLPIPSDRETEASPTEQGAGTGSVSTPLREYITYPVEHPSDCVEGNKYYYTDTARVCYYDFDRMMSVTLCSQPNCKHNDESCNAFIAPKTTETELRYLVREGVVYAIFSEDAGHSLRLITLDPITGDRTTLVEYDAGERFVQYLNLTVDGNVIYYVYNEYGISDSGSCTGETNRCYLYDLTTGQTQLLQETVQPDIEGFGFSTGGLVLYVCTENFYVYEKVEPWTELPLGVQEFVSQGNDVDTYFEYVMDFLPDRALYIVNRKTGEEQYFADSLDDLRIQDMYSAYCDKKMSFVRDDTFCIYDGRTGEITELFYAENVGYQALADGRIFYNTYSEGENGEAVWTDYWYDITTGEHLIRPNSNLGILHETETHFITSINTFISKQDYYNGNYDKTFR